jgi:hypothetical protein
MWTVWKLTESQGSVNFCSSDLRGNVYGAIRLAVGVSSGLEKVHLSIIPTELPPSLRAWADVFADFDYTNRPQGKISAIAM